MSKVEFPSHSISSIPEYLTLIRSYPNICWIYRGQSDSSWPLIPKAGREDFYLPVKDKAGFKDLPARDILRFKNWRELAVAYNRDLPTNDFECLAYAQHYGLATRLLDWTTNPLVALFFSVDSDDNSESVVFCYCCEKHIDPKYANLEEFKYIAQYTPPPFDKRILMQNGVFTVHSFPFEPLLPNPIQVDLRGLEPEHGLNLVSIKINLEVKSIIKRHLDEIGISRKTLFPDLEGLSNYINWGTKESSKFSKKLNKV